MNTAIRNLCMAHILVVTTTLMVLAGCAADLRGFQRADTTDTWPHRNDQVLLMPPSVTLVEVTASGLEQPRSDWTREGAENLKTALKEELSTAGMVAMEYESPSDDIKQIHSRHVQLVKLHSAVGRSIITRQYLAQTRLPTKEGSFDWTIGDGARRIRDDLGTDYALFVYFKDAEAGGGRAALQAIGFLFAGVAVSGSYQIGFASLVDLNTGDIVWFNRVSTPENIRVEVGARSVAEQLLEGIPICGQAGVTC